MNRIFMLTVNQVHDTPSTIPSSYIARRSERKLEFYASRESAEKRRDEIYEGTKRLTGFIDTIEVQIYERELLP